MLILIKIVGKGCSNGFLFPINSLSALILFWMDWSREEVNVCPTSHQCIFFLPFCYPKETFPPFLYLSISQTSKGHVDILGQSRLVIMLVRTLLSMAGEPTQSNRPKELKAALQPTLDHSSCHRFTFHWKEKAHTRAQSEQVKKVRCVYTDVPHSRMRKTAHWETLLTKHIYQSSAPCLFYAAQFDWQFRVSEELLTGYSQSRKIKKYTTIFFFPIRKSSVCEILHAFFCFECGFKRIQSYAKKKGY